VGDQKSQRPSEVYFKTDADIDEFAEWLRQKLNLPSANRSAAQRQQRRVSANLGGLYYLFEVLGLELYLLRNAGETEIPERGEYALYLIVRSSSLETDNQLAEHLRRVAEEAGVEALIDSLSA